MAYTVLARRYRSTTFDEVVGQEHVAQTLKRAIESGRIAHAYLFCGTRGVGKTSMARILAKSLNCHSSDGPTANPCGKCSSCIAIARGDDIDVIEIDAASNTGVDKTRSEIVENVQYRPGFSRYKIFIIDEAHMLSKQAFNALLKTMEEPPEHVKFILATTEPEKILPTILSRCQRYDFRNIGSREIADHLKAICKQEKIKADDDALLMVARAGAGSMRDSLSLLDRLLSIGEKHVTVALIEQSLGLPRGQAIFDLVNHLGAANIRASLEAVDALMSGGLSTDTLIASLAEHLRHLLILRTCGPDSGLVEVPGFSVEEMNAQAQRFEPIALAQDIAILEELRRTTRSGFGGRALLDATLVRLALAAQFASVDDLIESGSTAPASPAAAPIQKKKFELTPAPVPAIISPAVPAVPNGNNGTSDEDDDLPRPGKVWDASGPSLSELLAQREASNPAPVMEDKDAIDANVEPVNRSDLVGVWSRVLAEISQTNGSLSGLLRGACLAEIRDGLAIVRFDADHGTMVNLLEKREKKDALRDQLSAALGQTVGVKFELDTAPAASTIAPAVTAVPRPRVVPPPARQLPAAPMPEPGLRITDELRAELREDEFVRVAIEALGAEIVKVE